ncbi:MAG: GNAT family N-acetyltransferase [Oscillospiraceae bacterium]|nr:GNAT family N-acetyltransferase [Oscillospiraceae bacterium]
MINYRKAIVSDVAVLAKIRSIFIAEATGCSESEREKLETANKAYFEVALADDSFVAWLALDGEKIIATSGLSFSVVPPTGDCISGRVAYIMNMFTYPEYRKQGIGTELFKRIADEAKSRGYNKITLSATDMGRPLYEKYGFKDVTDNMVFYAE